MTAKAAHVEIAARIRRAARAAAHTDGDVLHGLIVSVRAGSASMCSTITVRAEGLAAAEIVADPGNDGTRAWTPRTRVISRRLHELAAEALDWQDENDRMRFVDIKIGSYDVPDFAAAPRVEEDDARVCCPACGEFGVCELAPCGDPGCDAYDCQRHDDCTPADVDEQPAPVLHTRWTTVQESRPEEAGEWNGWVGVSTATLADFDAGIVHGRRVDVDAHCVPDCAGCAAPAARHLAPVR